MRVLIVGGYGTFGGRLVELIDDEPRLTLIVSGRSLSRAEEYCAGRTRAVAQLIPALFDRERATAEQLKALQPDLVVDASGPFQAYGRAPYRLVELCAHCEVNYLDLADGSEFVGGVAQFDELAKAAGIFVLSGVSSFPVLTAAVVRRLSAEMAEISSIRGGIAPSPFAGVGTNVIRAIASYSGQRISVRRGGKTEDGRPFVESILYVVGVPGRIPLEQRRFSLVDVPDLAILPALWPSVQDVWIGAAPVPAALHRALNAFAWLVKTGLLPGLSWMSGAMHFVTARVRWGEHRGGMFVEVRGRVGDGSQIVRTWYLLAEGSDGPLIPCMAVEAIIRGSLAGKKPPSGARTAISDVGLSDYEALFRKRTICTGIREHPSSGTSLFQRNLGATWQQLSEPIRRLHAAGKHRSFTGRCSVRRGRNPIARLVAGINGFPTSGTDKPITVTIEQVGDAERWSRTCDGRTFSSEQIAGRGRSEWLVCEKFGSVRVDAALLVESGNLRYIVRRWSLLGVPLPLSWGPRSKACESTQDGKFKFDVEISHPLTGLIVHYTGTLDL